METLVDVTVTAGLLAIQMGMPVVVLFLIGCFACEAKAGGHLSGGLRVAGAGTLAYPRIGPPGPSARGDCPGGHVRSRPGLSESGAPAAIPCWQRVKKSAGHLEADCLYCDWFVALPALGRENEERRG